MTSNIGPAMIYTQFYDTLPEKNVERLSRWNKQQVLQLLISVKLALQHISRNASHELINKLVVALPKRTPKYGPIDLRNITNKTVMLQIIRDVLTLQANDHTAGGQLTDSCFEDIIDTIMIYNEYQFTHTGIAKDSKSISHAEIWKVGLMQDMNAENAVTYNRLGGIKQVLYMQFLKEEFGTDYTTFEKGVVEHTGLASMQETALLFINIELMYQKAIKNPMPFVVIGPHDPHFSLLEKLELVIDGSKGAVDVALDQFFASPFLKLNDGNLYLLGTTDFDLITTKSWDYYLHKHNLFKQVIPELGEIGDLKGRWGKKYIESYLCFGILKSLEKAGLRVLPSDDKHLPDVTLIVNERDIFMIEVKSSAMHHKVMSERNLASLQDFVDKNFATGTKGVAQLYRNIAHLAGNAEGTYQIKTSVHNLRIYPIIIYTETHLTKHAVNDYVNTASQPLAAHVRSAFQSVAPVTMIPLDFLLENIGLLQKDRQLLRKLVTGYHHHVTKMKTAFQKKHYVPDYLEAMQSFENWCVGISGTYREDHMKIFDMLRRIFKASRLQEEQVLNK